MAPVCSARVTLRPTAPADSEFLFRVYASTRRVELAAVAWSEEEKAAFLRGQFTAQTAFWAGQYERPDFRVIEVDGEPAGRFYLDRGEREIRVVDIALLPEYRGAGTGTRLLRELIEEAGSAERSVTLHVEIFNPARRFYERLGFRPVEERGAYLLMRRAPAETAGGIS